MAVSSLQLILRVSHAAAACPGSSSSQRAAFRLGGFWHPPSGRCGVDTTIPARVFRRLFWGQFSGSTAQPSSRTGPHRGPPLSAPVGAWRPSFADAWFRCPSPPLHGRVVRNCEVAPKSEPASCKLQAADMEAHSVPASQAGGPHPSDCALAIRSGQNSSKTQANQVTYRTVPVQAPSSQSLRLLWNRTLCISLHAADDAPVISHSGRPGTLVPSAVRAVPGSHCCLRAARPRSQSCPDDAARPSPGPGAYKAAMVSARSVD
jgi:hypothetical protein